MPALPALAKHYDPEATGGPKLNEGSTDGPIDNVARKGGSHHGNFASSGARVPIMGVLGIVALMLGEGILGF